ncbi:MAG: hypothetical protein IPJ15_11175 [Actinomycetales bacterium]|nr:hypothetical protein [Candidatus Phosphoribacter baldrii]
MAAGAYGLRPGLRRATLAAAGAAREIGDRLAQALLASKTATARRSPSTTTDRRLARAALTVGAGVEYSAVS